MEPYHDGPKVIQTTRGYLGGKEPHANENATGRHILQRAKAKAKPKRFSWELCLLYHVACPQEPKWLRLRKAIQQQGQR